MQIHRIILLSALAILACAAAPAMAATYQISLENNGDTVNVIPGDTITLSLKENPSTGFRWIMETSGRLQTLRDTYSPSSTGLIGAAGMRTWKFLVTGTGTHTISAIYKQSWMPTTGDEQKFTLDVISGYTTIQKPVSTSKFRSYQKPILYKTVHYP